MARSGEEIAREVAGYLLLLVAVIAGLAVASHHPLDPSLFSAARDNVANWFGRAGAAVGGLLVTLFGVPAVTVPALLGIVGWRLAARAGTRDPGAAGRLVGRRRGVRRRT